jgi:hypothetical protein
MDRTKHCQGLSVAVPRVSLWSHYFCQGAQLPAAGLGRAPVARSADKATEFPPVCAPAILSAARNTVWQATNIAMPMVVMVLMTFPLRRTAQPTAAHEAFSCKNFAMRQESCKIEGL